mgnify:FL=1
MPVVITAFPNASLLLTLFCVYISTFLPPNSLDFMQRHLLILEGTQIARKKLRRTRKSRRNGKNNGESVAEIEENAAKGL